MPETAKPYFRHLRDTLRSISRRYDSRRSRIHTYWRNPWDSGNAPGAALGTTEGQKWSQFLVQIVKDYAEPNMRILEIGCGAGRNLNYLYSNGYSRLFGVEINVKAVELMKQHFPDMASHAEVYNSPIEEVAPKFSDGEFDVVYTMALLQHIHPDSEWVFPELVRITKEYLITIENEKVETWRHFPRNYKLIFESLGLRQVQEIHWSDLDGESISYYGRVFSKTGGPQEEHVTSSAIYPS